MTERILDFVFWFLENRWVIGVAVCGGTFAAFYVVSWLLVLLVAWVSMFFQG